jgi:hypothetical protein
MGEIRPAGIGVVQVKATTLSPDLKKLHYHLYGAIIIFD